MDEFSEYFLDGKTPAEFMRGVVRALPAALLLWALLFAGAIL